MSETILLPFFVYGTLLSGEANYHLLKKGVVSCRAARVEGFCMYDLGPYPMIVEGEGMVVGELVEVLPERYAATLRRLDRLEGVDGNRPEDPRGLYRRVRREAILENGERVEAWVYVGWESTARRGVLREGGDWRRRFEGEAAL